MVKIGLCGITIGIAEYLETKRFRALLGNGAGARPV